MDLSAGLPSCRPIRRPQQNFAAGPRRNNPASRVQGKEGEKGKAVMTTMCKRSVAAVSIAALLGATAVSPALADGRYRGGYHGGYHHRSGGYQYRHRDHTGAYIALGFGALALGALAYSASRPVYYAPPAYYYYYYYYPPPAPPAYGYYYYGPPAGYAYDPYAYAPDPQFDRPSN